MTLKQLFASKFFDQYEIADKLKVTRSAVTKWVDGTNTPRAVHIRAMAELLNVSPQEVQDAIDETAKESKRTKTDTEEEESEPKALVAAH